MVNNFLYFFNYLIIFKIGMMIAGIYDAAAT